MLQENYQGVPFGDERREAAPQTIPGRIMCAWYDAGGEGVSYHDTTPVNQGSGRLNPPDGTYLHGFRANEAVDTSYVKYYDSIDDHEFNRFQPEKEMLYVGWTEPGEWLNYSVFVKKSGLYSVELLYTSNRGGKIALDCGGEVLCTIESTYDDRDPVAWRQWHHWNKAPIAEMFLQEGHRILTLRTVEQGNMNYGYLEFREKN
ncbi:hypothetical protein AGMMS49928_23720 [Spirochaetia bacterium]|nr:hypothetical protein AGMMS49928_23720 [Spirochaetia bacterium]